MERKERRIQQRFSLQIEAKLRYQADNAENENMVTEETIAANISSGGAFLATTTKIPLASKVYLEFLVDYDQLKKLRFILSAESLKKLVSQKIWVKATGVVIRHEEGGVGIIFDQDNQLSPMDIADR